MNNMNVPRVIDFEHYFLMFKTEEQQKSLVLRAISLDKNLDTILKKCKKYTNDARRELYDYCMCRDVLSQTDKTRKWFVIMMKLDDTVTNENRANVSVKNN